MTQNRAAKLKAKLMQRKQRAMKIRYPTSREKLTVPNPLAPDYVGTYSPSPEYFSQLLNDQSAEQTANKVAGNF